VNAPAVVCHRLVVVAPDEGWLTSWDPWDGEDRLALGAAWVEATVAAVQASGLGLVSRRVLLRVTARPPRIAFVGPGIRRAEDVRAVFHNVMKALEQAGVLPSWRERTVAGSTLVLGAAAGEASGQGFLEVELTEVPDARR
jgi:hypothetical protein